MNAFRIFVMIAVVLSSTIVRAEEDEESYTSYDSIVAQLQTAADADDKPVAQDMNWDEVAIHGGAGFTMSYTSVRAPEGTLGTGVMKGFEAHFGMNLFSRKARMEGLFRNFAQEQLSSNITADCKEFEFRGVFLPAGLPDKMKLRFGMGLAARYMDISSKTQSGRYVTHKASTPATTFLIGFERKIAPSVAIGPDISYRSALTSDTFDKSSWDASLRLNATF